MKLLDFLLMRRRPREVVPQYPPRYWMDGREVTEAEYKAEITAMSTPPRNAWGGFKTEQEWLDLQAYFAARQAVFERQPRAVPSNTRFGIDRETAR